jgi:putative membrane protein
MFDHAGLMTGGWLAMLLIWVVPLVLLFLVLRNPGGNRPPSARELLDQAYARGELSRDEYLKKKEDLAAP